MKKIKKIVIFIMLIIICILILLIKKVNTANAAENKLNVVYVSNLAGDSGNEIYQTYTYNAGETSNNYSFTVNNKSYVKVIITSNVGDSSNNGMLTDIEIKKGNSVIKSDRITKSQLAPGKTLTRYLILDKGTYSIVMSREDNEYAKYISGTASISVNAQVISDNDADISTVKNAKLLTNGSYSTGVLTNETRDQYYKFKITGKATCKITFIQSNIFPTYIGAVKVGVGLYNSKNDNCIGRVRTQNRYNTSYSETFTLTRGSYYIRLSGDYYMVGTKLKQNLISAYSETKIKAEWEVIDEQLPDKPVLKKANSATKTIKGTAEGECSVYVIHNGIKYKTTSTINGKFKVILRKKMKANDLLKIYVIDDAGNKSKTLRYLVKKHKLAGAMLIKQKEGTRIVKGYTSKSDCKVIIKISKKIYHVKSDNKGYFKITLPVRIYKSSKAKIKVTDSYGNSSGYKKLKFIS